MLYASAPSVLGKLTLGTTGHVLVAGATIPAWQALTVNNSNWSGAALSAVNGGTGQAGGYTVGDILYANSTTTLSKLPAGSTVGHVLTSNGTGVAPSYQAAAGGSTNIGTTNLTLAGNRTLDLDGKSLGLLNASLGMAIGAATADTSAILDLTSTTEGFLPPRMTTVEMNAIGSPASGLMVFDRTTSQWMGYNGSSWVILG